MVSIDEEAAAGAPLQTAVVLVLFRRPERTARVLERIRAARPARLFLVADGPRQGDADQARSCELARQAAERVDWPCEVVKDYATHNLGLKARIPTGLDSIFEKVDRAIILEDDCLPHPTFFRYCDELLERYAEDERIMHVAGSQLLPKPPQGGPSYHFSRYPHIWGWATWRRAWRHFDLELREWHEQSEEAREHRLAEMFDEEPERRYWRHVWDNSAEIENWDAQWSYALLARRGLAVNPNRNLISNIGFDGEATNATIDPHGIGGRPLEGIGFPLANPEGIGPDHNTDAQASRLFRLLEPTPASGPRLPARIWQGAIRLGGRALEFVPEPVRPRIRHRDRKPVSVVRNGNGADDHVRGGR